MKSSRTIGVILALFSFLLLSGIATSAEAQGRGRGNSADKGKPAGPPNGRGNPRGQQRGGENEREIEDEGEGRGGPPAGRGSGKGPGNDNGVRDGGRGVGQGNGQGWWRRELKGQNSQVKNGQNPGIPFPTAPRNSSPGTSPSPGFAQPTHRDLPKPKKPFRPTQSTPKPVKRNV